MAALCCATANAKTTQWYVDGAVYTTTTCDSGDSVTPPTVPTKYGYTLTGWFNESLIYGTVSQSGTPTPDNRVEPVFYQNGDLILRAIDNGNGSYVDTYDQELHKITRRVGVYEVTGNESWTLASGAGGWIMTYPMFSVVGAITGSVRLSYNSPSILVSNYFSPAPISSAAHTPVVNNTISLNSWQHTTHTLWIRTDSFDNVTDFKSWLAQQYAAGTPVTIYYPLANPTEESYTMPSNNN